MAEMKTESVEAVELRLRMVGHSQRLTADERAACKLGADAIAKLGEICAQSAGWNDTVTALLRASREDV